MGDFQCGVRKIGCEIDVIQCSNCEFWFHIQCISMKKSDLKVWSSPQLHFFCRNCSYVGDEYNAENMFAASAFIKKPIRPYYPPQAHPELTFEPFTRTIVGGGAKQSYPA